MQDERAEIAELLAPLDALVGRHDPIHAALAHLVDVLRVHVDGRPLPGCLPTLVHVGLVQRVRADLRPRRFRVLGDVHEPGTGGEADEPLVESDLGALVTVDLGQLRVADGREHRET
jgi:hypothetical protein